MNTRAKIDIKRFAALMEGATQSSRGLAVVDGSKPKVYSGPSRSNASLWLLRGISPHTRTACKRAAMKSGMPTALWVEHVLLKAASNVLTDETHGRKNGNGKKHTKIAKGKKTWLQAPLPASPRWKRFVPFVSK